MEFASAPKSTASDLCRRLTRRNNRSDLKYLTVWCSKSLIRAQPSNPLLCRGYCFVDYRNPADAPKAIEALHGKPYGSLRGLLKIAVRKCGLGKAKPADSHGSIPPLQMQVTPAQYSMLMMQLLLPVADPRSRTEHVGAASAPNPLATTTSAVAVSSLLSTNPPSAIAKTARSS